MQEIHAKDFNLIANSTQAVVDFYSVNCQTCRLQIPILNALETQFTDLKFYRINTDHAPAMVQQFGIAALPTLFFIKNGQIVQKVVGLKPQSIFCRLIKDWYY